MTKISIIIPCFNIEKYVEKSIQSAINQTLSDIEMIVIDDCSKDTTSDLIKKLADQDSRIKAIYHDVNKGTSISRKVGVDCATGRYIMFLDGDDWLELDACEKLYEIIEQEKVEILQYGTILHRQSGVSDDMLNWVEGFLAPFPDRVLGSDILRACFIDEKFDFNITDKLWDSKLCKKAFLKISEGHLVAAEDRYAFFVLGYNANSYLGVMNQYYHYNLGVGITGGDILDLERFEKRNQGAKVVRKVQEFLESVNDFSNYQDVYKSFENQILWDCVDCWHNKLSIKDSSNGYKILLTYWSPSKVTAAIARVYFEQMEDIYQRTGKIQASGRNRVGIYYRYLGNEGMKDALQRQIISLHKTGKEVFIITDSDRYEGMDYLDVPVLKLPSSETANWDKYEERSCDWSEKIQEFQFELILYASPTSHIYLIDKLLIESFGIPVIDINDEIIYQKYENRIYNRVCRKLKRLVHKYKEENNEHN